MSKKNRVLSMPVKAERRDLSDKSKLIWERFTGPLAVAAAQMNAAIQVAQNTVARCLIEAEELDPNEWVLDMDTAQLIKRPPVPEKGI